MQGLWKANIAGWDHKGAKRKYCSRKHLLRDKARYVRKWVYRNSKVETVLEKSVEEIHEEVFSRLSISFFRMGKRGNKDIKNMVERRTRASVKAWIDKGKWDEERKAICYERSIAWLID